MAKNKKILFKVFKILGKIFLGILILLLLVVLFIRSPWGQNIIKDKLISSVEEKTGAKIELEKLFIAFDGDIEVNELYLEDPEGDTVAYAQNISANIGLWALINGNSFDLNQLEAEDLRARITRKDSIEGYNYEFLTRAYASDSTQAQTTADTTSAPMQINIGDIDLQKIDVVYRDDVTGIDSKVKFELLELEFSETDLAEMIFRVDNAILSKAEINYEQTKPFPESDSEPAPLPLLEIDNLEFSEIKGVYSSAPDSIATKFNIAELNLDESKFNLKDNSILSNSIELYKSEIGLEMQQKANDVQEPEGDPEDFKWPEWNVDIANIDLEKNSVQYSVNNARVKKGVFDPNAISLDSLIFKAENVLYKPGNAAANIQQLQLEEGSGIDVNKFNFQALVSDERIAISELDVAVNNNRLAGNLEVSYSTITEFINDPGKASLDIAIKKVYLNVSDIYRFQPALKENEYVSALAESPVRGSLNASGKVNNINLQSLNLSWSETNISGNGSISNLQDPDNISFSLPNVKLNSRRSDIIKFVK